MAVFRRPLSEGHTSPALKRDPMPTGPSWSQGGPLSQQKSEIRLLHSSLLASAGTSGLFKFLELVAAEPWR